MKKLIFGLAAVLAIVVSGKATVTPLTGTYDFTTAPAQTGVTYGAFTSAGLTTVTTSGAYQTTGYSTGGIVDSSKYVQFTVSANSGILDLTQLSFTWTQDSHGLSPDVVVSVFSGTSVAANAGYNTGAETQTFAGVSGPQTSTFDFTDLAASGVTIRFYGVSAQKTTTGISLDNVQLQGTYDDLTNVPEPVNVALVLFGCTFAGVGAGRKFLKKKA